MCAFKKLKGKIFVFTGNLENLKRIEAVKKINEMGGVAQKNLDKNVSYLVAGKDSGSKMLVAKDLGVSIIDEREFLKMIS